LIVGITADKVNLHCTYTDHQDLGYHCRIENARINSINDQITITGNHIGNFNDAQVQRVLFISSWITHIPNEIFEKFQNLRHFDAPSTNLQKIGELKNCRSLLKLDVSRNRLPQLTRKSIQNCNKLQSIDASFNLISDLEPGFLLKFPDLTNLNLIGNRIKELKEGSLLRANNNPGFTLSFGHNPLERLEGSVDVEANFAYLNFQECNLLSVDPRFLDKFNGQITTLDMRGNRCVNTQFGNVNSGFASRVRELLKDCFGNFEPRPTLPTTQQTTPYPPVPQIGRMVCRLETSIPRKVYNCETNVELTIID
jgi:hypothetical protein